MQKEIIWLLKEKYDGVLTKAAKKDIERLKAGEPLDYIIGFTEFFGCKIDLRYKPLIPRPETEFWVEKAIFKIYADFRGRENQRIKILDIFSGSGCIGASIMRHIKNSKVTFIDSDKNAIGQIRINCKENNLDKKRYNIIQSDVFAKARGRFDYIFANPPYIPQSRKGRIQKSVLKYEPKTALFGGNDGLFYIRKFLAEAKNFLNVDKNPNSRTQGVHYGARIFMEFDSIQRKEIEKLLKKYNYKNWEFKKDQYEKWRWVAIEN